MFLCSGQIILIILYEKVAQCITSHVPPASHAEVSLSNRTEYRLIFMCHAVKLALRQKESFPKGSQEVTL